MKLYSFLLSVFTALGLQAQTFGTENSISGLWQTAQFKFGQLLPTDKVNVDIEYPEYEPLDKESIRQLKATGFRPTDKIRPTIHCHYSRGETVADIAFVPVVIRDGRWMRLKNYELRPKLEGPRLSASARTATYYAARAEASSRYAGESVLSKGKWVKIRVKNEGIYQLTDAWLKRAGFTDPTKVKLYGYGGKLLPESFTFTGEDALIDDLNEVPLYRRNGSALFFADGLTRWVSNTKFLTNTFSEYSYYFLTESTGDDAAPAAFPTLERGSSAGTSVHTVSAHALYDNDAYVWYGGGRDFYDNNDLQSSHTFKLNLPGIADVGNEEIQLNYDVSAGSRSGVSTATFTVSAGSQSTGSCTIMPYGEGESARGYRGNMKLNLNGIEELRVKIKTNNPGRLNYLYATYNQNLSTTNPTVAFTTNHAGAVTFNISNADADTRVWQLGNAREMTGELSGELNGNIYTAYTDKGYRNFVIVDLSKEYEQPELVGNVDNQNLHADADYDYIIIVPASGKLTAEAERLAQAHREYNQLRVKVVRADQLYNEFSSGTPDATAYRRYLKMLYDKAATMEDAPRYLLLFGNCIYDNRMITQEWKGHAPDDYLLAYERNDQEDYLNSGYSIGTLHSYVTDDYYGYLDDSEGKQLNIEKVDLGIGRFVCQTVEEARWLVEQAIRYMSNESAGVWKNRLWAIADVGDNNLHMNDGEAVCRMINRVAGDDFMLRRIYPDAFSVTKEAKGNTYPEATGHLTRAMQQGALIFNYNGHGNPDRLSHYFLLDKSDMTENVSPAMPLWIYASCEITPYDQVSTDLGRESLFSKQGNAIGVICASRSVYANYNRALDLGFIKHTFTPGENGRYNTLGDALRLTKAELVTANTSEDNTLNTIGLDRTINKLKYVLLGDPAIRLRYPLTGVYIDSINHRKAEESQRYEIPVGAKTTFSGFVNPQAGSTMHDPSFNGIAHATVFMPPQDITCKGQGNTTAEPLTYSDYTQMLFDGSVEVKEGRFEISFIVPRGTTFSTRNCKISLYALSDDRQKEYNGTYNNICINGSADIEQPDSIGPDVHLYLDTPDFPQGSRVGTDAVLYAQISDSTGISMMSGNMGHDMEMWMDGNTSDITVMNDYFSFAYGSYSKGTIQYPLTGLEPGRHTLVLRVWDVFNNSTTSTLDFIVEESGSRRFDVYANGLNSGKTTFITSFEQAVEADTEVETEVYNISGQRIWHKKGIAQAGANYAVFEWNKRDYGGNPIRRGVYLYQSKLGSRKTSAKKIVIP